MVRRMIRIDKKKYEGSIFGFNYAMDFDTDEEFIAWLIAKLKTMNPLLPKVMDGLLNESEEFKALKEASP